MGGWVGGWVAYNINLIAFEYARAPDVGFWVAVARCL